MPLFQVTANSAQKLTFATFLAQKNVIKPGFDAVFRGKTLEESAKYLLSKRLVNGDELNKLIAEYFGIPYGQLLNQPLDQRIVRLLPSEALNQYKVLPYKLEGTTLYLAIGRPSLLQYNIPQVLDKIRQTKGFNFKLLVVPEIEIEAAIKKINEQPSIEEPRAVEPKKEAEALPTVPLPPATVEATASEKTSVLTKKVESDRKEIDLATVKLDKRILNRIPASVAKRYKILVFAESNPESQFEPPMIKIAAVKPDELHVKEIMAYIEQKNKILVECYKTSNESFELGLKAYEETVPDKPDKVEPQAEEKKPQAALPTDISQKEVELPGEKAPWPPAEKKTPPVAPESKEAVINQQEATQSTQTVEEKKAETEPEKRVAITSEEGVVIQQDDIIARPTEESVADLQRLAKEQQLTVQDQNLDRLLRKPIVSVGDLAGVIKQAIIPEIVAATLFLAIRMQASDVHIEAGQDSVRFRYRIDGILHDIITVPKFLHAPLISRIKILSKMKIDEQRVPQDGRFDVVIDKRQVDLRVSTLPTVHGEKIVMRLLDKSGGVISLEQLGLTGSGFDRLIESIGKPYGIILSTGPTGSGKSTTLYAVLSRISKPGVNIITLEDPVEYELPGINQSQVKPGIGFTFAEGLRSVLRQDPNVIMVGEVRDLETAAMATHAALTGHLVLTTLHTNDAAGALPRLINMGVEPFLITSSINAVIGQRLVRKICENCREPIEVPPGVKTYVQQMLSEVPTGQLKNIDLNQLVFYHGKGCDQCTNGYKGRIGIFEVLVMSDAIEELAVKKAPASDIKKQAVKEGMIRMTQDGLMKALKGITTVDEVMRVTTTEIKEVPGVEA